MAFSKLSAASQLPNLPEEPLIFILSPRSNFLENSLAPGLDLVKPNTFANGVG